MPQKKPTIVKPQFDEALRVAIDLAKMACQTDAELSCNLVFRVLLHLEPFIKDYVYLADRVDKPNPIHSTINKVRPEGSLKQALRDSMDENGTITTASLFSFLLFLPEIEEEFSPQQLAALQLVRRLHKCLAFQQSPAHKKLLREIASFGTMISHQELPSTNLCGRERFFFPISCSLIRMMRKSVLLVGPEGVGKSAIVREFTRRVVNRDPSIPHHLYGAEIFQLSPDFLRAGTTVRPQFQNRVCQLISYLQTHPKIIVVINPLDGIMPKGARRYESLEAEEAIRDLIKSDIPIIACLRSRLLMENQPEWDNLFDIYNIPEPDSDRMGELLKEHWPAFSAYYYDLQITDDTLSIVADYARRSHSNQCEPQRSLQLLDELCVRAITHTSPITTINKSNLEELLSNLYPKG